MSKTKVATSLTLFWENFILNPTDYNKSCEIKSYYIDQRYDLKITIKKVKNKIFTIFKQQNAIEIPNFEDYFKFLDKELREKNLK